VAAEYSSGSPSVIPSPTSLLPNLSALTPSALPAFSPLGTSPEEIANARTALTIQQLLDDRAKDNDNSILSPVLNELARVHSIHTDTDVASPHAGPTITLDESRARLLKHYILTLGPWVYPVCVEMLMTAGYDGRPRPFHPSSPSKSPLLTNSIKRLSSLRSAPSGKNIQP
jgi:hypothetical protein